MGISIFDIYEQYFFINMLVLSGTLNTFEKYTVEKIHFLFNFLGYGLLDDKLR